MKKTATKSRAKTFKAGSLAAIVLLAGSIYISDLGEKSIGEVIGAMIQEFIMPSDEVYQTAEVTRVVDGDTIVAEISGQEQRIRLIGINTPESAGQYRNNPQPGGKEAAAFMTDLLPQGKTVYLTSDVSDTDRYGRLLRYVWLERPEESRAEEIMVNCLLLEKGYASLMTTPPDVKYVELFQSI